MQLSKPAPFNIAVIPMELRRLCQWVCWRYDTEINPRTGKRSKIPVNPKTLGNAGVNYPNTWQNLNYCLEIWRANPHLNGVGLVLTPRDPYTAIDLDNCVIDGNPTEEAAKTITELHGYTEISPSGKGVRILIKGKIEKNYKTDGLEIYGFQRWVTITSNTRSDIAKIPDRQNELNTLIKQITERSEKQVARTANNTGHYPYNNINQPSDDSQIWQALFRGKNGHTFKSLFDGDTSVTYNDDSRAVIFLGNALAIITNYDHNRIKRMLYQTGLDKTKWEETRGKQTWLDGRIQDCINFTKR